MVYIIAEIGVNHNGNVDIAKELVNLAKQSGANAVKFQTFKTNKLVRKGADKADYQKTNDTTETQYDMLKKYELSFDQFREIKKYCDFVNIEFISTPFDKESAELLNDLNVNYFKIGSGDLTNYPLLRTVASFGKNIILSTGMSNLSEVEKAVDFIRYCVGFNNDLIVLHCVSSYPTKSEDVNMRSLTEFRTMEQNNDINAIGFSDHTHGSLASSIAIACGAKYIEKHFTLSKFMKGPDHKASLDGPELIDFIQQLRETEIILGSSIKQCQQSEINVKNVARRSLAYNKSLFKGHIIEWNDLIGLRPADGISAHLVTNYIGKELQVNVNENDFLNENDF